MLQVAHISKAYGIATVLDDVSFLINPGDRVGLIGPNGCGKTTLLRIITGLEAPDSGHVRRDASATLGYLPQGLSLTEETTLGEYVRSGLEGYESARRSLEQLATQMTHDNSSALLDAYAEASARFEALGGYAVESRITQVLQGLALASLAPQTLLSQLSGGQRTRAGLARLLLAEPTLLILDEPTNHLDIDALEWLEEFLADYAGAALVVSHDRTFLDATVSRILALDDRTHRLTEYPGDYTDYAEAKSRELDKQWSEWEEQQEEIARLKRAASHLRGLAKFQRGGKADTGDKFAKGFFANRGLETMRRAKQMEARLDRLMNEERIDKPRSSWQMKLEFGAMPRSGQIVLTLEDLGHSFGERWLFRHANLTLRHGDRIALVGSNGSGKTTLLRILAGEFAPTEGIVHLGANVHLGYMPQEQETLDHADTPLDLIRRLAPLDETAARHLLHFFLFSGDEVFTPIGSLSYGERARLLLAKLVVAGANCLLLDEPVNHLDMPSRERFQAALDAFPGTLIVAAHDRAFISHVAKEIWTPEDGTLHSYTG